MHLLGTNDENLVVGSRVYPPSDSVRSFCDGAPPPRIMHGGGGLLLLLI